VPPGSEGSEREGADEEASIVAYEEHKADRTEAEIDISGSTYTTREGSITINLRWWQWILVTIIAICALLIVIALFLITFPNIARGLFEFLLMNIEPV
jgi:hypothetical protein